MSDHLTEGAAPQTTLARALFAVGLLGLFAVLLWLSLDFPERARYMPVSFATFGMAMAALEAVLSLQRRRRAVPADSPHLDASATPSSTANEQPAHPATSDDSATPSSASDHPPKKWRLPGGLNYVAWILGYVLTLWLLGAYVGSLIWLAGFLLIEARRGWMFTVASLFGTTAVMWLLENVLSLRWPPSILF